MTDKGAMRILITGSRNWYDHGVVHKSIAQAARLHFFGDNKISKDEMESKFPFVTLVHGGARGADEIADRFGREKGMQVEVFHAQWKEHGKAAGPIRNSQMVSSTPKPDICLAFVADGSRGTQHCMKEARQKGIPVIEIPAHVA